MFRINIFILSMFVSCKAGSASLQHFPNTLIRFPSECVQAVVKFNFPCKSKISIVCSGAYKDGIEALIQTLSEDLCYSIITREFKDLVDDPIFNLNDLYIIATKDILEFNDKISELLEDVLWNPNAKYIVHIDEVFNIKELFEAMIKNNIYNVIFISSKYPSEPTIYTYYPFANQSCGRQVSNVVKLGSCDDHDVLKKSFKNKIPTEKGSYKGCTLVVAIFEEIPFVIKKSSNVMMDGRHIDGLEQFILKEIAATESLNIKYIIVPDKNHEKGVVLSNGTHTGILHYLQNREADVLAGGMVLFLNRAKEHDYIYGYAYISVRMFTAVPSEDTWKILYKEFGVTTWLLIGLLFILVAIFFSIIDYTQSRGTNDRFGVLLRLWGYFFSNTDQLLSKQANTRKILFWWIAFTFFISSFYLTGFCSLITGQTRQRNNYHIGYPPNKYSLCVSQEVKDFFKVSYNETTEYYDDVNCKTPDGKFATVAANPKLSTIDSNYAYEFRKYKFVDDEGAELLDVWDYSMVPFIIAIYVPKGFYLRDLIQTHVNRMFETGLITAQQNQIFMKSQMAYKSKRRSLNTFGIKDMRVALIILLLGDMIAFLVFILEVSKMKCTLVKKH